MNQFALPLDWPEAEAAEKFIVTPSNSTAIRQLERTGSWPVRVAILTGPRKSGKSLFGRIFAARSGGSLVDDAEQLDEQDLFHRWNVAQESGHPLLIVAQSPPSSWKIRLPDLSSRLAITRTHVFHDPDDMLVRMLLEKQLTHRGLFLKPEIADYIASRIERTHVALLQFVERIDNAALSQQKGITMPLVRLLLGDSGAESDGKR